MERLARLYWLPRFLSGRYLLAGADMMGGWKKAFYNCFDCWFWFILQMLSLMYDGVGHNFWSIVEFIELQQRSIGLRATDRLIEMAR